MKTAIFYHARINGGNPPVDADWTQGIFTEQMETLGKVGLVDECESIFLGLSGDTDQMRVLLPHFGAKIKHGDANSELPTLALLQSWLPGHEDYAVLYFHAKGARHPQSQMNKDWRLCMENVVLHGWRRCVQDLEEGCDSVGAHWLTKEDHGTFIDTPFWGGNFWWAKAAYLLELPSIDTRVDHVKDHQRAEAWIGTGPRVPKVKNYAHHWPNHILCANRTPIC